MSLLSNNIEKFIKELLEDNNYAQIQRNELASFFNCAPSQINYVLTTRFSIDNGYFIESKKGGGGYIKITRFELDKNLYLKDMINNKISDSINQNNAKKLILSLINLDIITEREAKLILSSIDDKTLFGDESFKNELRANILKNTIFTVIAYF